MIWVLSILLVANLFFVYLLNGKKLFSPTIIVNGVFLLSALTVLINWGFFGYEDISFYCVLIVMFSMYALSAGELLLIYSIQRKRTNPSKPILLDSSNIEPMRVGRVLLVITCIIGVYVVIAGTIAVHKISVMLGNNSGVLHAFSYARRYVNAGNSLEIGRIITYPAVFVKASSLYCMLVFIFNRVNIGRSSIGLLIPGVLYCLYTITSTSRTGVLEIFCAFFIMYYAIFSQKNNGFRSGNKKLIRMTIIIAIIVALVFVWLGNLRTVAYDENTASDIVNYMGSPLIVFSRWLERSELSPYPGYATFPQVVNILNKAGIVDVSISYSELYKAEEVLAFSKSNLKTWLRAPIQDFTVVGMLITRFALGMIYSYMVQRLMRKDNDFTRHPGRFIFACLLFYPLISAAFADKFGGYIQLETLYMAIIFTLLGKQSNKWKNKSEKKVIC